MDFLDDPAKRRAFFIFGVPALFVLVALVALLTLAGGGASGPLPDRYVALGDSFTSGMGIYPRSTEWTPSECQQSTKSYPHLVQRELRFSTFADGACTGAVMNDFYSPQVVDPANINAAQFDLLNGDENVVTLSIGGNDAGFWGTVLACFQNPDPRATPCRDRFLKGGVNLLERRSDEVAINLNRTLADLKQRAPKARIFLVGYQQLAPADGRGCRGYIDASVPDLILFNQWQGYMNAKMKAAAAANGVAFVDAYSDSAGHDSCNPVGTRWVEPMLENQGIIRMHPNADGERETAKLILAAVRGAGAGSSAR
jgi:lysophospholipase L1-like esterase